MFSLGSRDSWNKGSIDGGYRAPDLASRDRGEDMETVMLRKFLTIAAAAATAVAAVVPAAAQAQYWGGGYEHVRHGDRGYYGRGGYDRGYGGYDRGSYGRGYDRSYYGRGRYYEGYRGRCRDKGTGGTILGAIAGGLLGHEIGNGRYDRGDGTTGAIIGAGVGALAGRAIDRDC